MELLMKGKDEVVPFYDFPAEHHRQISSAGSLDRLNKALKHRGHVIVQGGAPGAE